MRFPSYHAPIAISPSQKTHYLAMRQNGFNIRQAAEAATVSYAWARAFERGLRDSSGRAWLESKDEDLAKLPNPIALADICDEAKACLADDTNDLFSLRYFGHIQTPWQSEAMAQLIGWYRSPDREYAVLNEPPGAGKTTALQRLACRLIVENRAIRVLFGSRTHNLAARNTGRVRRALERTTPAKAKPDQRDQGLAVDALACLAVDFGRFRPLAGEDIWRRDEGVVLQFDGAPIDEKEPTFSAYGIEGDELGNRFEVILWDDLDSSKTLRTLEAVTLQRAIYDDEAESRLESGGLLALVQQRLAPNDMSRHCLDKSVPPDEDDPDDDEALHAPMYRHVVYKAHYPELCQGRASHGRDAKAYPEGCLLEPKRLPYSDLRKLMAKSNFPTVYQQEDTNPEEVLVQKIWVHGGTDPDTGEMFPGCWDHDRAMFERPATDRQLLVVLSTDPSGTMFWGHTLWAIDVKNGFRYLMGLKRKKMAASDVLEFDPQTGEYSGLLVDWMQQCRAIGLPFSHWIVEKNSANRWIYRYRFYELWCAQNGVTIIEHNSDANLHAAERGIEQSIPIIYKHGQVRLPGRAGARGESQRLVDEVTNYVPGTGRKHNQDLAMTEWFVEFRLPLIQRPTGTERPQSRPAWLQNR